MPIYTSGINPKHKWGKLVRRYDVIACAFVIVIGLVWFVAAEVAYDGSLMEDPFLRSGVFAQYYVPLAAMYLIKAIGGESWGSRVVAWLSSFLVLWATIAADVWVTHYKPNCDYCCIPANECFIMESVGAVVATVSISVSDVLTMRWIRKIAHPMARQWFIRRAIRLVCTVLFTLLFFVLTYTIASTIRLFVK